MRTGPAASSLTLSSASSSLSSSSLDRAEAISNLATERLGGREGGVATTATGGSGDDEDERANVGTPIRHAASVYSSRRITVSESTTLVINVSTGANQGTSSWECCCIGPSPDAVSSLRSPSSAFWTSRSCCRIASHTNRRRRSFSSSCKEDEEDSRGKTPWDVSWSPSASSCWFRKSIVTDIGAACVFPHNDRDDFCWDFFGGNRRGGPSTRFHLKKNESETGWRDPF